MKLHNYCSDFSKFVQFMRFDLKIFSNARKPRVGDKTLWEFKIPNKTKKQTSEKFNFNVIVFSFNFQSSLKLIPPKPYHGLFYHFTLKISSL